MRILLLLFIGLPIVEMWLLIKVGSIIGALPTIGLVLLTAAMGLALLRYQGHATLASARQKLQANQLPAREIADGLFYAVGGALLLTPGFVTDAIGFACLTPGIRTIIIQFFARHLLQNGARVYTGRANDKPSPQDGQVIEGDYERHSDK